MSRRGVSSVRSLHPAIAFVLTVFFLGVAIVAQLRSDAVWAEHFDRKAPVHRFIMPASVVRYFTFGFESVLADYYWVTAVQDFNKWDQRDEYYIEYFRIIATLDPKFEYPYIFAALTAPSKRNPDALSSVAKIAEQGMAALPESWQIPFYVGLEYHAVGKSYERAAHYLGIAASISTSPEVARTAYGLFLLHTTSDHERSRALFQAIYDTTENAETKRIAEERIALLDTLEAIDKASVAYKAIHHTFPKSLDQLVGSGFIRVSPEFSQRFPVVIDPVTGKASLK